MLKPKTLLFIAGLLSGYLLCMISVTGWFLVGNSPTGYTLRLANKSATDNKFCEVLSAAGFGRRSWVNDERDSRGNQKYCVFHTKGKFQENGDFVSAITVTDPIAFAKDPQMPIRVPAAKIEARCEDHGMFSGELGDSPDCQRYRSWVRSVTSINP